MSLWGKLKKFVDKQDMSNYVEPPGLGIAWLWKLPDTHPFFIAGKIHDLEWDRMKKGTSPYPTSLIPDANFYDMCWQTCCGMTGTRKLFYLGEAKLFYKFCRMWGKKRWKQPDAKSPWKTTGGNDAEILDNDS